ncbi:hypothetical protein [Desulfitobacterium dichloroeliminans]|uniref:hypothetical protein n=1 Tax=Desulfitobacterium dichloroeliminans TaxID=233055 RepID=UPI000249770F|nr:hypothetical protein [Desulfitobacterium dichloroeliminans]
MYGMGSYGMGGGCGRYGSFVGVGIIAIAILILIALGVSQEKTCTLLPITLSTETEKASQICFSSASCF